MLFSAGNLKNYISPFLDTNTFCCYAEVILAYFMFLSHRIYYKKYIQKLRFNLIIFISVSRTVK